jgi:hypothetical protein
MNDEEMLATLRSSLTTVKESLADVHLGPGPRPQAAP